MANTDFLGMSDEDFEKQPMPVIEKKVTGEGEDEPSQPAEEVKTDNNEAASEEPNTSDEEEGASEITTEDEEETPTTEDPANAEQNSDPSKKAEGADKSASEQKDGKVTQSESTTTDYEAFYKQIMTPFKANGRTIELKTPQEAIQLMQMGANYTKKMQELVPHRKVLTMLQNNGLLDEGKLSFLIDIERKDPEAIKKLIQDAGLDPMEIDTSTEPAYQEGNHRVSDEEAAFHSTLDEMKSTPERVETLRVINGDWDQASKEALWKNPEIMSIIHDQRENGIYDRITTELNRRRTLGTIPVNVPFLQAYKVVGDELTAANAFADLIRSTQTPSAVASPSGSKSQVVATRVAAPKAAVSNGDRAAAASTSRQTSTKGKGSSINPLAMSDEEFLKQFEGRL